MAPLGKNPSDAHACCGGNVYKKYVINYLLFLHVFKQLVSMQDEGSFASSSLKAFQSKSQVGLFCIYAMFLHVVRWMKFEINLVI